MEKDPKKDKSNQIWVRYFVLKIQSNKSKVHCHNTIQFH